LAHRTPHTPVLRAIVHVHVHVGNARVLKVVHSIRITLDSNIDFELVTQGGSERHPLVTASQVKAGSGS
jgi:hypothetical protein